MAHYYTYTNYNSQRDELRYKVVHFSVYSALLKLKSSFGHRVWKLLFKKMWKLLFKKCCWKTCFLMFKKQKIVFGIIV